MRSGFTVRSLVQTSGMTVLQHAETLAYSSPTPTQGPGSRVQGYGVRGTGYGVRGTGYGVRVTGYGLRGTGYGVHNEHSHSITLPHPSSLSPSSSYSSLSPLYLLLIISLSPPPSSSSSLLLLLLLSTAGGAVLPACGHAGWRERGTQ
eukprot:1292050-Rhodomonas_salina.1